MAPRRLPARFRIGLLIAGASAGAWLTATPRAGQALPGQQGVPSIAVPRVQVPSVVVPTVTPGGPQAMSASPWMNPARADAIVQADRLGLNYLPGEVLVKFKDGVDAAGETRALSVLASQPTSDTMEWAGEVAVVRDRTQPNAYILADQLKGQPEIEYAEPNFIARIKPWEQASTPMSTTPSPLRRASTLPPTRGGGGVAGAPNDADYAGFQWNFQLIGMPGAWDIQPGGSGGIIVAVIDTGMTASTGTVTYPIWTGSTFQTLSMPYSTNPDLPVSRHVLPQDYVGGRVSPPAPLVDLNGHGTHVSGTIAEETNNGVLVSGIAYNVKIMPVKVCSGYWDVMISQGTRGIPGFFTLDSTCTFADIAAGIRYAVDNGAKVLNISLGGPDPSTTMQSALQYAAGKGAFISISMGNDYEKGNPTSYPAFYARDIGGAMSVAAVDVNADKAWYSDTGAHCEIAAPGGDDRSGAGRPDSGVVWQSTLRAPEYYPFSPYFVRIPRFDHYDKQGYMGTSMAAPHVAGLAALLMSQMPALTGAQVEQIIRETAKDLGSKGRDDSFGYGLIQPRTALFGHGISRR